MLYNLVYPLVVLAGLLFYRRPDSKKTDLAFPRCCDSSVFDKQHRFYYYFGWCR